MTAYECMIKTNRHLITGGQLSDEQKNKITSLLISARTSPEAVQRFYRGVNFADNKDHSWQRIYPKFFIPPYNDGKKYKTILGQTPKTQILSVNMYELEILRLLYITASVDSEECQPEIRQMFYDTLQRLRTTCFGCLDDGVGECFDTSLVVLRFLATVLPGDADWIRSRIKNYTDHAENKKRSWHSKWYFWLCLSELPFSLAQPEIERYKTEMENLVLNKSYVMHSDSARFVHPMMLCILRNILANYPEYSYIRNNQPYVSEKDDRLRLL